MSKHTENADYNSTAFPSSGILSASNTRFTHTFQIINDANIESPEFFIIHIVITGTTPPSLTAIADPNRAAVRIIDDDGE